MACSHDKPNHNFQYQKGKKCVKLPESWDDMLVLVGSLNGPHTHKRDSSVYRNSSDCMSTYSGSFWLIHGKEGSEMAVDPNQKIFWKSMGIKFLCLCLLLKFRSLLGSSHFVTVLMTSHFIIVEEGHCGSCVVDCHGDVRAAGDRAGVRLGAGAGLEER